MAGQLRPSAADEVGDGLLLFADVLACRFKQRSGSEKYATTECHLWEHLSGKGNSVADPDRPLKPTGRRRPEQMLLHGSKDGQTRPTPSPCVWGAKAWVAGS